MMYSALCTLTCQFELSHSHVGDECEGLRIQLHGLSELPQQMVVQTQQIVVLGY